MYLRIMKGQKHVIVVDADNVRRYQLEVILSFVGEHFISCTPAELTDVYHNTNNVLTVIVAGNVDDSLVFFCKSTAAMSFFII